MTDLIIVIGTKTYSSWSLRGWLAARHTGLTVEEILLPLDTPEFYERIKDLSPTGCVPALHHGDIRVWDSLAIIDYCAHIAPGKFWWPDDNNAFALARSMCAEMHSGFTALRSHVPMNLSGSWKNLELNKEVQTDVERADALWQEARTNFGKNGPFLFGQFGAADMMFAPVVARFMTYGIAVSDDSQAYMSAMVNQPLIKSWYEHAAAETQVVKASEIAADAVKLG